MDGKSLRNSGPIGHDESVNGGEDARQGKLFDAVATPHPDHCEPENKQVPEPVAAPPKGNLGHRPS